MGRQKGSPELLEEGLTREDWSTAFPVVTPKESSLELRDSEGETLLTVDSWHQA